MATITAAPSSRSRRPRKRRGWLVRVLMWIVKGVLIFVVVTLLQVCIYRFVPVPFTLTMLFDPHGMTRHWTPLSDIDANMPRAVIAGEDAKFCSHHGFDVSAIEKAYKRNEKGGRIRGGSTISQQTAKNVFLWQGGGYVRKALEAWYTVLIETIWGKRRIMEVYLNVAETGIGTYGVNAGAQRYFHHDASNLTPIEAARIAAVLPLPKVRGAVAPMGFVRRYGNRIAGRIATIRGGGYDRCLR